MTASQQARADDHECAYAQTPLGRRLLCSGPWYMQPDYYLRAVKGKRDRNLYACEAHAKMRTAMGPGGPVFRACPGLRG